MFHHTATLQIAEIAGNQYVVAVSNIHGRKVLNPVDRRCKAVGIARAFNEAKRLFIAKNGSDKIEFTVLPN